MPSVDVLSFGNETALGKALLKAAADGARSIGMRTVVTTVTNRHQSNCDWVCIHAAGQLKRSVLRFDHIGKGGSVASWDHAYFGRDKDPDLTYLRVSINELHPQHLLSKTPPHPERWDALGIMLRNDYDKWGQVIVAGTGGRARARNRKSQWELRTVEKMKKRFPKHRVVYRPKPGLNWVENFGCPRDERPVEEVLKGASLLVCQHSNIALDACVAGIPVICDGGIAHWLYSKTPAPSANERLDLLRRVAWWQYQLRNEEMIKAWRFLNAFR